MYINPFWCGVIATILAECVAIAIASVMVSAKSEKEKEKNN